MAADETLMRASDFEIAVNGLLSSSSSASPTSTAYPDDVFDKLARYLSQAGKEQWSLRPRTYLVLRLINRLDSMDAFILDGLFDIALPYTYSRLPAALSPGARNAFLEKQQLVMCKAGDLEMESGRHRHFSSTADTNFVIVKQLGSGYFGVVDHVRSKLSLEEYARKRTLRARTFSRDKKALKVFENELSNLKRLSHRHLVKYVGSYTDPSYIGLLISPVADCDLKVFLSQSPFPHNLVSLLRSFFGCICSALSYLHSQKCRHKDIKPGNILVKNDLVLITDFGTSRNWSDRSKGTTTGDSGPYTPGYAAPEVVAWEARNESSDIWSLGCVYLDIVSVLKGESLRSKDQFFADHGNGGRNPRVNPQALQLWLSKLKSFSAEDNQPIDWIKTMLEVGPKDRVSSVHLLDDILGYVDEHIYYGLCCSDQEAEVSSCHSSEPADDTSTDDERTENLTNATSVVSKGTSNTNVAENKTVPNITYESEDSRDIWSTNSIPQQGSSRANSSLAIREIFPISPPPLPPSEPSKILSRNPFRPGYVPASHQETPPVQADLFQSFLEDTDLAGSNPFFTNQVSESGIEDETSGKTDADRRVANLGSPENEAASAFSQSTIQFANLDTGPIFNPEPGHSSVSKPPKSDLYLLFNAAAQGNVTDLLKYCGAEGNQSWKHHGRTIFHVAAENGGREAMQALLDLGCPVANDDVARYVIPMLRQYKLQVPTESDPSTSPESKSLSVWDPAAQHYNLTVQPDPNAIHKAVITGSYDLIRYFLAGGWDPDIRDDDNNSPLDIAISLGSFHIIKLLLQYGADPIRRNSQGQNAYSKMEARFSRNDCDKLMAQKPEYQPIKSGCFPYPNRAQEPWPDFLVRILGTKNLKTNFSKPEFQEKVHINKGDSSGSASSTTVKLGDTPDNLISHYYSIPPSMRRAYFTEAELEQLDPFLMLENTWDDLTPQYPQPPRYIRQDVPNKPPNQSKGFFGKLLRKS